LLYGEVEMATRSLTVPHPRMHLRRFVLEPLYEIDADLTLPDGRTVSCLLDQCRDQGVKRTDSIEVPR